MKKSAAQNLIKVLPLMAITLGIDPAHTGRVERDRTLSESEKVDKLRNKTKSHFVRRFVNKEI